MSTYPGASGSSANSAFRDDPEYVRLRRRIIRDNHPDRGGSDEALIAALSELDAQWERRTRLRHAAGDIRLPGFIPPDVARQATDLAEQYTDEVLRRATDLQDRARRVVGAQTPRIRKVRRTAGKAASSVVRNVQQHLPRHFPGARRYTDTRTTRTEKQ